MKTYDSRCLDLAIGLLMDCQWFNEVNPLKQDEIQDDLAAEIQSTFEDFLERNIPGSRIIKVVSERKP